MKKATTTSTSSLLRPPIVAVLGHVDHGKTTLLDAIRNTSVTEAEAGGITQHIGAYQVTLESTSKKSELSTITFIDTPGHAAFAKMRSRGAQAADIAVLVVAANDGVKPQTKEAITHIKKSGIPLVVALNKTDLPEADPQKVYGQLAREDILVESLGGQVVAVPLSAKTKQGIKELLEVILLLSQMKEIKGDANTSFSGVVVETRHDKHRGVLVTIIVKEGTLRVGDTVYAEQVKAKVRAMTDSRGKSVRDALPGMPVEVMGWEGLPQVGAVVTTTTVSPMETTTVKSTYSFGLPPITQETKLKLILKTDVLGTLEAIKESLKEEVEWIGASSGEIVESDILLAKSTGAFVIGFNTRASGGVKKLAEVEGVRIKTYTIIYELLDEVREVAALLKEPSLAEEVLGEAIILQEFLSSGEKVAGAKVRSGRIAKGDQVKLLRGDKVLSLTKIKSLRQGKNDANQVSLGTEFGMMFGSKLDFKPGDLIIAFKKHQLLS